MKTLVRIPLLVSAALLGLTTGPSGASADAGPLVEKYARPTNDSGTSRPQSPKDTPPFPAPAARTAAPWASTM